jgi:hypothetical protein
MNWNSYFEMMRDWKKLPAYRAEPRIDSIVGFYLPEIATEYLNDQIVGIIPELPLRLATLDSEIKGDKSYKVDFYLLGLSGKHYLVEFKTDPTSRRDKQDDYLKKAKAIGMPDLIKGIFSITKVSTFKPKYNHLLSKLQQIGLVDGSHQYCCDDEEISIIYVQPYADPYKNNGDAVIDFKQIADWLERNYGQSDFEKALAATLLSWCQESATISSTE